MTISQFVFLVLLFIAFNITAWRVMKNTYCIYLSDLFVGLVWFIDLVVFGYILYRSYIVLGNFK